MVVSGQTLRFEVATVEVQAVLARLQSMAFDAELEPGRGPLGESVLAVTGGDPAVVTAIVKEHAGYVRRL